MYGNNFNQWTSYQPESSNLHLEMSSSVYSSSVYSSSPFDNSTSSQSDPCDSDDYYKALDEYLAEHLESDTFREELNHQTPNTNVQQYPYLHGNNDPFAFETKPSFELHLNPLETVTMSPPCTSYNPSPFTVKEEPQDEMDTTTRSVETNEEKCIMWLSNRAKKSTKKHPILSWFLLEALECPESYRSMIKWVDRKKGIFEFSSENKERLARQWGIAKNNRKMMTYQKMARALRIYIKKERVLKKMNKKLQYVFLPSFLKDARIQDGKLSH